MKKVLPHLYIITGTTKGLGHSLVEIALNNNDVVISISRSSAFAHENFFNIKHDLKKISGIEKKLQLTLKKINLKKIEAIHLINNAAVIDPIGAISNHSLDEINKHIQINLVAPIYLTKLIVEIFKAKKTPMTYTSITSGAAIRAIPGWSLYCSSKAALRMFTDCMEVDAGNDRVKFLDFSPGVMDTDMQVTIRKQTAKTFSIVENFRKLKENNLLLSPEVVAGKLFSILKNPSKINKAHYDVKDL